MPGLSVAPADSTGVPFPADVTGNPGIHRGIRFIASPFANQTGTTRRNQAGDRGKQEKLATIEQVSPSPRFNKKPGRLYRPGFLLRPPQAEE
ncbi:hypothetical protein [Rhodanobacter lindaniclasticus]